MKKKNLHEKVENYVQKEHIQIKALQIYYQNEVGHLS